MVEKFVAKWTRLQINCIASQASQCRENENAICKWMTRCSTIYVGYVLGWIGALMQVENVLIVFLVEVQTSFELYKSIFSKLNQLRRFD